MKLVENVIKSPQSIQSTQVCDKNLNILEFDFDLNQAIFKNDLVEVEVLNDHGNGFKIFVRKVKPVGYYNNKPLFLYSVLFYDEFEELEKDGWDV